MKAHDKHSRIKQIGEIKYVFRILYDSRTHMTIAELVITAYSYRLNMLSFLFLLKLFLDLVKIILQKQNTVTSPYYFTREFFFNF